MHLSKFRAYAFAVVAASVALAWAVPALAQTKAARGSTVTVTMGKPSEFKFIVAGAAAHGSITFKVTNKGAAPHDFKLCNTAGTATTCTGKGTAIISAGGTATLTVTVAKPGMYEYLCDVPGHAAAGMKGQLKVT